MFSVGDEVVCVDAVSTAQENCRDLVAGGVYHVVYSAPQCVALEEHPALYGSGFCRHCRAEDSWAHYSPWRFVKLPKQSTEMEREAQAPDLATVR